MRESEFPERIPFRFHGSDIEVNVANDSDGKVYNAYIEKFAGRKPAQNQSLVKALHYLVMNFADDMSTESTMAIGYLKKTIYVAKLARVGEPTQQVQDIESILAAPLDGDAEEVLSIFNDDGACPVEHVVGVGLGQTGLHAEMMIVKKWKSDNDWRVVNLGDCAIVASQGACPGCAGFMNENKIWHSGVRENGRVSSRWINPDDGMVCGSEVTSGITFSNRSVGADYQWKREF